MTDPFVQAVRAFQGGDLRRAEAGARGVLVNQPDHSGAMQLLGACLLGLGNESEGLDWMQRAAEAVDTADAWYNLGSARLRAGQAQGALEALDRAIDRAPELVSAWMNRGAALDALGQAEAARAAYARVLAIDARHPGAINNTAQPDLEAGARQGAEDGFRRCLSIDPRRTSARIGLARALLEQGRLAEAHEEAQLATKTDAASASAWQVLARVRLEAGQIDDAIAACREALARAPEEADSLNSLGSALFAGEQVEEAEASFRQALERDSAHPEAWGNLAVLLDTVGREEALAEVLAEGLDRGVDSPGLKLVAARDLARRSQPEAALDALDTLMAEDLPETTIREAAFERARVLDRLGRHQEAYGAFQSANDRALEDWRRRHREADTLLPSCRSLRERIQAGWGSDWPPAFDVEGPVPAFLLGFQRSGTTLLDTMLGGHGDVHVMEEQPVLNRVIDRIDRHHGRYPDVLGSLDREAWGDLRRFYFRCAAELSGWPSDGQGLLLDKSPLNSLHGVLIARLFPNAPVVHLLRHPADVCLSGFMQDFTLSPFMARYTSLEGVAETYAEVMTLWEASRDAFGLRVHQLAYERLVESPEPVLRELLDFLGLSWSDAVLDHTRHARERVVDSPSLHQIRQPLYRSARYRWRHYAEPLAGVWPVLEPWIARYGYAEPDGEA